MHSILATTYYTQQRSERTLDAFQDSNDADPEWCFSWETKMISQEQL